MALTRKEHDRLYRERHKEKLKAKRDAIKDKVNAKMREKYNSDSAYRLEKNRKDRERAAKKSTRRNKLTGISTANMKEYRKAYRIKTREKRNADKAKRRAQMVANTPELTKEDQGLILDYYAEAAHRTSATTIKWEVDHIVPISLGGAHAPWNLQVVPKLWNAAKLNRHEEKWPYAY